MSTQIAGREKSGARKHNIWMTAVSLGKVRQATQDHGNFYCTSDLQERMCFGIVRSAKGMSLGNMS